MRIVLLIIGIIALVCGIKFIFDARMIILKYFGKNEINDATLGLKMIGFILTILGGFVIYFNF